MKYYRITNGLGKQRIIPEHYLKKIEEDYKMFKETTLHNYSSTDPYRLMLERYWTIVTIEEIEEE